MSALADPFDGRRAVAATGLLREFNDAGVLAAADVHVALRLAALAGDTDERVALAAALAVRGPRLGHVYIDLATIRDTATVESEDEVDLSALAWPEVPAWVAALAASPVVALGEEDDATALPLRLVGTALYLDRYWREERAVAADLLAFAGAPPQAVDDEVLVDGLERLFDQRDGDGVDADARQRLAGATAVLRRFAVVAGGPGTGKTTTVARIVALLAEQASAAGSPAPLVALAAPTAKAAARLQEAVHEEAAKLTVDPSVRSYLDDLPASTLHRLLGWRPRSHSRFRHNRTNRLPHDVVIVDETSMVSLSLRRSVPRPVSSSSATPGSSRRSRRAPSSATSSGRPQPACACARRHAPTWPGSPVSTSRRRIRRPTPRSATESSCSTAFIATARASPTWPTRSAGAMPMRRSPRSPAERTASRGSTMTHRPQPTRTRCGPSETAPSRPGAP
jgi:hypothetical protein